MVTKFRPSQPLEQNEAYDRSCMDEDDEELETIELPETDDDRSKTKTAHHVSESRSAFADKEARANAADAKLVIEIPETDNYGDCNVNDRLEIPETPENPSQSYDEAESVFNFQEHLSQDQPTSDSTEEFAKLRRFRPTSTPNSDAGLNAESKSPNYELLLIAKRDRRKEKVKIYDVCKEVCPKTEALIDIAKDNIANVEASTSGSFFVYDCFDQALTVQYERSALTKRLGEGFGLVTLVNRSPRFERGQYRLNFHGRVKRASSKNMQIIERKTAPSGDICENLVMQFGKVSSHRFTLDFQQPLSSISAFGIALTQFL
ncbi:Tubby protein [Hondaea fermentalgiana]|uniref:Tubby protein n=1 Tax=Hondaea fermentalgiana TaxID=2315210 RepID=A0A2R5G5I1_9STRA|nr:Tubby protein [Hondaea fermentalgiana]|eukprot:GBG26240.1 Tubby protein [Hondaea fermentalgiana]